MDQHYAAEAAEILSAARQILNQAEIDETDRYRATTAVQVAAVYAHLHEHPSTTRRPSGPKAS